MKHLLVPLALALSGAAIAKLPPPDDAAKAKAAETAAKNAWQAKVDGYQLCRVQDKVAAQYRKTAAGRPAAAAPAPAPASTAAPAPASAAATAPAATAAAPAAAGAPAGTAPASAQPTPGAPGTPVTAASPPPPCTDPGPFASNLPAEKPLEASGAHSPTGTAASPPSVKEPSAAMAPAKKP